MAVAIGAASFVALATDASTAVAAPNLSAVEFGLAPVATGLSVPVSLAWRVDDDRIYVAEQTGTIRIIDPVSGAIDGTVLTLTHISSGGERGLLGLAFSLDGSKLYVDYTDSTGTIHIAEYTMAGDTADTSTARDLLTIPHSRPNHNGGQLVVGSDGDLYIGVGDGGGGGDPDRNGQNVNSLLGKILRIDPRPTQTMPYRIPHDNPFFGQADHRGEIWMYGLRNPWRFSFDSATGDLWIADVGQDLYEEVDYAPAGTSGQNWGWNLREGFHPFKGGAEPPDGHDPLLENAHADGNCAVIGGFVYHGSAIANLGGAYLYSDLCQRHISGAVQSGGTLSDSAVFPAGLQSMTTFGQDHDGELYAANLTGGLYKLVPLPDPAISVGDRAMLEGDTGTRPMKFPVTLSKPATSPVTVSYSVTGTSATGATRVAPGVDFKLRSGTLTFNPGQISKMIAVPVLGDATTESDETLKVTLSAPTGGYALDRSVGTGTILNDDANAGVTLGIGDGAIVQQGEGTEKLTLPVTRSAPTGAMSVDFTLTPGTATYTKKATGGEIGGKLSGTLAFKAGVTHKDISVTVWPDLLPDADHQFTITLSDETGATVTVIRATGTGTLLDP
jgi:glucose/arabinose dehydrogenase